MDIRCERCATEYEIDETRVPDAGITIKCSTCSHVFKVRRPAGHAAPRAPEQVSGIELRLFRGGQPVPAGCPDIATLQRWVVERRVAREDEFSQNGGAWRRLGEAPELAPFFELVAAAERATQPTVAPVRPQPAPQHQPQPSAAVTSQFDVRAAQHEVPAHAAVTQQMQAPVFGPGSTNPMNPLVRAPVAQPAPPAETASTLQFRAPAFGAGLAMPPPDQAPDAKQTLQFRALSAPTPAASAPVESADTASTLQFRAPSFAAPEPAGPPPELAATLPESADNQATLTFRVPQLPRGELPAAPAAPAPRVVEGAPVGVPTSSVGLQNAFQEPARQPALDPDRTDQFRVDTTADAAPPASLYQQAAPRPAPAPAPAPVPDFRSERPLPKPEVGEREDDEPTRPARTPEPVRKPANEPAWASGQADDEEEDPEIAAFKRRGRGGRIAMAIVAAVLVIGAIGYFVVWPRIATPEVSEEARAQYEQGRQLYLTNVLAKFPQADGALQQALTLAGKAKYPEAHGALAELHAAWAERLLDDMSIDAGEASAKTTAGQMEQAQAAAKRAEGERADAKKQLDLAFGEAKTAFDQGPESLAARRALIDYYRVANDVKKADEQIKKARAQAGADPETLAHLAAVWAQDPTQLGAAESQLGELVGKLPQFVRARYWLAQVHLKRGNQQAALADMEAIVAAQPEHERAKAFLAQAKALAAAQAAEPKPEETAAAEQKPADSKADPKAEEKPAEKPVEAKAEQKPAEQKADVKTAAAEQKAGAQPAMAEPKPVDVDKLINQAATLLDKGKSSKALDLYDQALAAKPKNSDALYGRGLALFDLGKTDDSIEAFKRTLDTNPRFADAMIGMAEAYKQKGQTKDAVKWYQKYLDTTPNGDQAAVAKTNIERLK